MADIDLSVLTWRKSSACYESGCVEVAACAGVVMVRDTGDADKRTLAFSCRDWNVFLMRVRVMYPMSTST
jgi:Domain of unknown function (DUF397)